MAHTRDASKVLPICCLLPLTVILVCILGFYPSVLRAAEKTAEDPRKLAEMPIEQLMGVEVSTVLGASRYEQRISDAPASISIITSEDIKRYGYRTLTDVLNSLGGFHVTSDRNYNYLGSAGFLRQGDYNSRMLLLVDGHRVNNNIYDTAPVGNEFLVDIDLVERVEVIRGPGSSIYGSNAFFGVINVITRGASHIQGLELSGEIASFDTDKERATFGRKFGNVEMVLSATRSRSMGQNHYYKEYNDPATNWGWSDNSDRENYSSFFANLKIADVTIQGAYGSRTMGIPTGAWSTVFNDNRTESYDAQGYIDVRYQKRFSGSHDVMARLFYDYFRYDGKYMLDTPPVTMNRDVSVGKYWGAEAVYTGKFAGKHTLMAGFEFRDNFLQQQKNFDDGPYVLYLDDSRNSYSVGVFAQGELVISDRFLVNGGLRYDHYKDFSGRLNPRIAVIFTPFEKTTAKLVYGEAYRIPNAYELYYTDGNVSQKANPGLDPETIRTCQLILEQYFGGFRFSLSGFYYNVENMITQMADPVDGLLVFTNAARAEGKGLQFEVEKKWSNGISGRLSYSYQNVTSNEEGIDFNNFPEHLVKLNAFFPIIRKKLGAGIEAQYVSPRKNLNETWNGGYALINATLLSEKLIGNLDLSLSVYNLLDKKYSDPASGEHRQSDIEQNGRVLRFKATYRF